MHDESLQFPEDLNELDKYLEKNPDDLPALMYSAYCEDTKRWKNQIEDFKSQILYIQLNLTQARAELISLTKWQNFWRKLLRLRGNQKDIENRIVKLEQKNIETFEKLLILTKRVPEDWRYKLAANGNNLFIAR